MANNIVFRVVAIDGVEVEERSNYVLGRDNYDEVYQLFADPDNYDFHLAANDFTQSHIIDKSERFSELVSSDIDRDGRERTSLPDPGAYEMK